MNIKAESPLNIHISPSRLEKECVGDVPEGCCNHQANPHHVNKYHIQEELKKSIKMNSQNKGESCLNNEKKRMSKLGNL